jgi:hypothetical protein
MSSHDVTHPVKAKPISAEDEIPESIKKFREVISKFKDDILSKLESPETKGKKSSQTIEKLHDAAKHIIHFGNILTAILENNSNPDTRIIDAFKKNGVSLLNMSYDEKKLCKHYIFLDIYTNTYDVNGHASNKY